MSSEITPTAADLALVADGELRRLWLDMHRSWIRFGAALVDFHDRGYHASLGFPRFSEWAESRKIGRSTAYEAMRIVRNLLLLVPMERAELMSKQNAKALLCVPKERMTEALVSKAQELTEDEFWDYLQDEQTGIWKPVEVKRTIVWRGLPLSLAQLINRAIEIAMRMENTDDRKVGLERIFSEFITGIGQGE